MSYLISSSLEKTIFLCFSAWIFRMKGQLCLRMVFGVSPIRGSRSASVEYRFRNTRECTDKFSYSGILLCFLFFLTVRLASETPVVYGSSHICAAATRLTLKWSLKRWRLVVDDNGSIFFNLSTLFFENPSNRRTHENTSFVVTTTTRLKSSSSSSDIAYFVVQKNWLCRSTLVGNGGRGLIDTYKLSILANLK